MEWSISIFMDHPAQTWRKKVKVMEPRRIYQGQNELKVMRKSQRNHWNHVCYHLLTRSRHQHLSISPTYLDMAQGKSAISKKKPPKSQGGVKKKQGRTKKGLKKQVKPKKTDQIISKGVSRRDFEHYGRKKQHTVTD